MIGFLIIEVVISSSLHDQCLPSTLEAETVRPPSASGYSTLSNTRIKCFGLDHRRKFNNLKSIK